MKRTVILLLSIVCIGLSTQATWSQELVTADHLVAAVNQLDLHSVRKLLKQNPQAVNQFGSDGESPLTACILTRTNTAHPDAQLECIRFLLSQGADPNLRVGDIAPLELAMLIDVEIVRLLLEAGADPTDQSEDGLTPLDTANSLKSKTADEVRALLLNASR